MDSDIDREKAVTYAHKLLDEIYVKSAFEIVLGRLTEDEYKYALLHIKAHIENGKTTGFIDEEELLDAV